MKHISKFGERTLTLWLMSILCLAWLLSVVRERTIISVGSAEGQIAWDQWREDVKKAQEEGGPVQRRAPRSAENPALILMRDRFPVILSGAIVTWTFFYGFTVVIVRGLMSGGRRMSAGP